MIGLAEKDKPREKLMKYGPTILSTTELMAILLDVGTRKGRGVLYVFTNT